MAHPARRSPALVRGLIALAVGAAAAVLLVPVLGWAGALLAGWSVLALTDVIWVLVLIWPMDAVRTRAHATAEDPGRPIARLVVLVGGFASLGAVVIVLLQTGSAHPARAFVLAGVAVIAVAASWALIQVDYLLRYAHVYYTPPEGGIHFNQDEDPVYSDFVYFSVGLGMTYQVADTSVRTNAIRRIVVAQTLLAYLFGAVILATVINLVTSLR